jgi:predicted metal-binding membrane protein
MSAATKAVTNAVTEPATKAAATGAADGGRRRFGAVLGAVCAAAVWATVAQHASMDALGGMPMAGGWTLSAGWLRPCGWRAAHAFAAFAGMWGAMTVTMMLPVLAPVLWRYRQRAGALRGARAASLVAVAGAGYFSVWMAVGALVFPAGTALAAAAARLPALAAALPFAAGAVVLGAGMLQFSGWKMRRLACCRHAPDDEGALSPRAGVALACWHGVRAALRCGACCGNLMAISLAVGMMDLRVMTAVTVAIAAERLAPAGERVARIVGAVAIGAGAAAMIAWAAAALA